MKRVTYTYKEREKERERGKEGGKGKTCLLTLSEYYVGCGGDDTSQNRRLQLRHMFCNALTVMHKKKG